MARGRTGTPPNGNMTARIEAGIAYAQTWDAQNRLVKVACGTIATTESSGTYTFAYR